MKPEPPKVFDVAKPRPSNTSRPIIVGHRPVMADPMVKRPTAPVNGPIKPAPSSSKETTYYRAKPVEVTDEMRSAINTARTPLANFDPDVLAGHGGVNATEMAQAGTVISATTPTPELPAQVQPVGTAAAPVETPSVPASPDVFNAPLAPPQPAAAPAAEPHFESLPLSHEPVTTPRRLRQIIVWLAVVLLLLAISAYLLIDAGIINVGVNLPFHIFSQST
ncbi:MAG TPA: hypothetical protein VMT23_02505 [Candidatus Binatia bacterium]|nr:hypothetical protein [Candidatus Binatia bacterium]